jgi:hypothetical protein
MAILTASPNPVPAGDPNGRTTISWEAKGESGGRIYVSENEGEESLLANGRQGSTVVDWIQSGSSYEFRLYNSDHTKLLDKVLVTKAHTPPNLRASPNPVSASDAKGETKISWNAEGEGVGKVYLSVNEGQESLFAVGRHGSESVSWIETGSTYEFRLYNSDRTKLLDTVIVVKQSL